jgi:tripartite-type tricarboxylate transporter receptor subunit TctC
MRSGWRIGVLGSCLALVLAACAPGASSGAAGAPAKPAKPGRQDAAPAAQAAPRGDYFAGKTVTLLVNFSPGGPTDVFARLLARSLDQHIPGRPTIIVENKPGAGGMIGMNYVYNVSKKDGLTVGVFTPGFPGQILGSEGVQYDEGEFANLGVTLESQASFGRAELGVKSMQELLQANTEVVFGGLSPDSSKDLGMRAVLNTLGVKYKYVTGYPGNADFRAAFQRGEINYAEESLTGWFTAIVPMIQAGQAVPMGQRGVLRDGQFVRDQRLADLPTYTEVVVAARGEAVKQTLDYRAMVALIGMNVTAREIVYPPGVDPALVEVMRQAVADTFQDAEFLEAAEKVLGFQQVFMPGAEAQELAQRVLRQTREDPEAVEYLKRLTKQAG